MTRAPPGSSRPVVVVADDDDHGRAAAVALLAPQYELVEAYDAASAITLAAQRNPDAVLISQTIRPSGALAALEALRTDRRTSAIPVVVMTPQHSDEDVQAQCLLRGAADVLPGPLAGPLARARLDRAVREGIERRRLEDAAWTDALTGLPNFRALSARLREEFDRARRYGHPLSIVMIDLDRLKRVNDVHGHAAGNQFLLGFAHQLGNTLRGTDFAARYGGDEFAVLLAHHTWQQAEASSLRLRRTLKPIPVHGMRGELTELTPSISVGVASQAPHLEAGSYESLLRAADTALYEAKRLGRDRVVVFERDLRRPLGDTAVH